MPDRQAYFPLVMILKFCLLETLFLQIFLTLFNCKLSIKIYIYKAEKL